MTRQPINEKEAEIIRLLMEFNKAANARLILAIIFAVILALLVVGVPVSRALWAGAGYTQEARE